MRLDAKPHFVELRVTEMNPDTLPRPGDARLEASFRVDDFSGRCTCWVDGGDLRRFATALRELYTRFRGTASLESMSPGELSLSLVPANSRGYVRINVSLSKSEVGGQRAASGSFEVELPALAPLLSWAESPYVEDA